MQRHAAVGAGVTQSEGMAGTVASDNQRSLKQHCLMELIAMNTIGRQGAIPEAGEHEGVGSLALGRVEFGHGSGIADC
jgi:hypothetical protein